jgi:hypothetical protein
MGLPARALDARCRPEYRVVSGRLDNSNSVSSVRRRGAVKEDSKFVQDTGQAY